jgi:hypothetical protein
MSFILPCPYCGADAKTYRSQADANDGHPWTVNCNNIFCEAAGPRSHSEADAIERWNLGPRREAVDPVPVRMPPAKWAKAATEAFLGSAKAKALDRFDLALNVIAQLRWWQCWRAPDLAAKALGIFHYWNREWQDDDFIPRQR